MMKARGAMKLWFLMGALAVQSFVVLGQDATLRDPDYLIDVKPSGIEIPEVASTLMTADPAFLKQLGADVSLVTRVETFQYCQGVFLQAQRPIDLRTDSKLLGYYTFEFFKTTGGVEVRWVHRDFRGDQEVGKPFIYGPFALDKLASHIQFFSRTHHVGLQGGQEFGPQEISTKLSAAGVPASDHVKVISAPVDSREPTQTERLRAQRDDLARIITNRLRRCKDQGYYSEGKLTLVANEVRSIQGSLAASAKRSLSCEWLQDEPVYVRSLKTGSLICVGRASCSVIMDQSGAEVRMMSFDIRAACGGRSAPEGFSCPDATACAKAREVDGGYPPNTPFDSRVQVRGKVRSITEKNYVVETTKGPAALPRVAIAPHEPLKIGAQVELELPLDVLLESNQPRRDAKEAQ